MLPHNLKRLGKNGSDERSVSKVYAMKSLGTSNSRSVGSLDYRLPVVRYFTSTKSSPSTAASTACTNASPAFVFAT